MTKEPFKRFEFQRGLCVWLCWEPLCSLSPPLEDQLHEGRTWSDWVPTLAPGTQKGTQQRPTEWRNNGGISGIVNNWMGKIFMGRVQPLTSWLGNISEILFLQVQIGIGTLICLDVEKIQGDHGFEDSWHRAWPRGGLSNWLLVLFLLLDFPNSKP